MKSSNNDFKKYAVNIDDMPFRETYHTLANFIHKGNVSKP